MEEQPRSDAGAFVESISDEDLWKLYADLGTTQKVSQESGLSPRQVRHRLAVIRDRLGHGIKDPNLDAAGAMERLVAAVPRSLDGGGELSSVDVGLWEVGGKDALTQQIVKRGLDKVGAKYRFNSPKSMPLKVEPFKSQVRAYQAVGIKPARTERIFIVGDQQLGFWCVRGADGPRFVPFHDERAIDIMMKALAIYQPDRLVIVGDYFDFPSLSKFQQEPEFQGTMQESIQYGYDLLGKIIETVGPDCIIDFIPGNHEKRMTRAICNNNPSLYNLVKPGDRWPIYSVQNLMDFDKRNIRCSAEYPSGEVWLASRRDRIPGLVVTHADPKFKDMRADAIYGHLVLPGMEARQVFYEEGPMCYWKICVSGCGNYGETSDRLRLTRTNTPSGRARMGAMPSFATVDLDRSTGLRAYGLHIIYPDGCQFGGKVITSKIATVA